MISSERPARATAGLFDSVRVLATTVAAIAQTRVELFGTEFEAELGRVVTLLIGAMVALALAGLALLVCALVLVGVFWDTHRVGALSSVAAVFAALAVCVAVVVRSRTHRGQRLFADTLGELELDWRRLGRGRAP